MFRTSFPSLITAEEADYLRKKLGVLVLLDLRSDDEREMSNHPPALANSVVYVHGRAVSALVVRLGLGRLGRGFVLVAAPVALCESPPSTRRWRAG